MKITCSVEVVNRALPSLNMAGKKAKKSILTIGKSNDDDCFIYHQSTENMNGNKYKVSYFCLSTYLFIGLYIQIGKT